MYTRCPKCSTCFRVTEHHLAVAKGKVRCGQCQLVFNAPEYAIDDLPVNSIHPKTSSKPAAPTSSSTKTESTNKQSPKFQTGSTLTADTGILTRGKATDINPDTPSSSPNTFNNINQSEENNLFNDNFDLDAAIDELTQATNNIEDRNAIVNKKVAATKTEQPAQAENNSADVFNTDAYDATNASSVADIMDEMEGQLSLDITESNTANKKTESTDNKTGIDKKERFNQPDLGNVQNDEIEESIVIETTHLNNINAGRVPQNFDNEKIPFQLRNDIERLQTPVRRRLHPLLAFFLIIILFVVSFSQLAYFRAHELLTLIPASRPLLEQFCEKTSCYYSGPRDIKQIQLLSRDVRLHPKEKKALLINAAIINNAHFAQPYPDIHIRLSDISGNVVAERVFNAKIYMGNLSNPFLLMKSKTPVHINFEVVDPGKDAINFEFTFL